MHLLFGSNWGENHFVCLFSRISDKTQKSLRVYMALGDTASKLETFVSISNYVLKSITFHGLFWNLKSEIWSLKSEDWSPPSAFVLTWHCFRLNARFFRKHLTISPSQGQVYYRKRSWKSSYIARISRGPCQAWGVWTGPGTWGHNKFCRWTETDREWNWQKLAR